MTEESTPAVAPAGDPGEHHAVAPTPTRLGTTLGEAAPTGAVELSTRLLVVVGTGLWALALLVTLLVPSLHEGDRSWWPWSCVTGIALGGFAWWYVGRGRGNAAGA